MPTILETLDNIIAQTKHIKTVNDVKEWDSSVAKFAADHPADSTTTRPIAPSADENTKSSDEMPEDIKDFFFGDGVVPRNSRDSEEKFSLLIALAEQHTGQKP